LLGSRGTFHGPHTPPPDNCLWVAAALQAGAVSYLWGTDDLASAAPAHSVSEPSNEITSGSERLTHRRSAPPHAAQAPNASLSKRSSGDRLIASLQSPSTCGQRSPGRLEDVVAGLDQYAPR
jgi:hypothetical protein